MIYTSDIKCPSFLIKIAENEVGYAYLVDDLSITTDTVVHTAFIYHYYVKPEHEIYFNIDRGKCFPVEGLYAVEVSK